MIVASQQEELKTNLINIQRDPTTVTVHVPKYPPARYEYVVNALDHNEYNKDPYRPKYPWGNPGKFYSRWIALESISWVIFGILLFVGSFTESAGLIVLSLLITIPICGFWIVYYGRLAIIMWINSSAKYTIKLVWDNKV